MVLRIIMMVFMEELIIIMEQHLGKNMERPKVIIINMVLIIMLLMIR